MAMKDGPLPTLRCNRRENMADTRDNIAHNGDISVQNRHQKQKRCQTAAAASASVRNTVKQELTITHNGSRFGPPPSDSRDSGEVNGGTRQFSSPQAPRRGMQLDEQHRRARSWTTSTLEKKKQLFPQTTHDCRHSSPQRGLPLPLKPKPKYPPGSSPSSQNQQPHEQFKGQKQRYHWWLHRRSTISTPPSSQVPRNGLASQGTPIAVNVKYISFVDLVSSSWEKITQVGADAVGQTTTKLSKQELADIPKQLCVLNDSGLLISEKSIRQPLLYLPLRHLCCATLHMGVTGKLDTVAVVEAKVQPYQQPTYRCHMLCFKAPPDARTFLKHLSRHIDDFGYWRNACASRTRVGSASESRPMSLPNALQLAKTGSVPVTSVYLPHRSRAAWMSNF
eukprot:gene115-3507_t